MKNTVLVLIGILVLLGLLMYFHPRKMSFEQPVISISPSPIRDTAPFKE